MALIVRTTLGTVQFHGWQGWTPSVDATGERFARLGQSGSGSQGTGSSGAEKPCKAWIACVSQADAIAAANAAEALSWSTVAMRDQWGRTMPRVRVTSIACEVSQGKGTAVIGTTGATHLVTCSLTIEVLP